eukprot:bmy_09929T0
MARIVAGPIELIGGTRAPHHQHLFLWPCLLSLLESRGGLLSWRRDPGPWHPMLAGRPQLSGAQPGRVRGQLCQSTSRAHTLLAMPWIVGREGSGGRNTSPWSPPPHLSLAQNSLRVSGERRVGRRDWPLHREGNQHVSILQEASKKCFKWFARTRWWGAGGLARLFHAILPQVTFTALSPATGPVLSHPPPEGAWGPQPSPCPSPDGPWPSLCHRPGPTRLPMCSLTCVRVCVYVRLCPLLCREAVPVPQSKQVNGH